MSLAKNGRKTFSNIMANQGLMRESPVAEFSWPIPSLLVDEDVQKGPGLDLYGCC